MTENHRQRMADVDHTHPYEDCGAINRPFERGPVVVADGGERNAVPRTSEDERSESSGSERDAYEGEEEDESTAKMKDIDHTPPHDAEGANRVFERGGREEPVESEE